MGQYHRVDQTNRQLVKVFQKSHPPQDHKTMENCVKLQVHFSDCQMRSLLRLEERERQERGEIPYCAETAVSIY